VLREHAAYRRELGPVPEPLSWGDLYGSPAFDTAAGWEPVEAYLRCELSHAAACAQLRRNAHTALGTALGSAGEGEMAARVELTCWPAILHESALATFRGWCEGERPGLDLGDPVEYGLALESAERVAYAAWAAGEPGRGEREAALSVAVEALGYVLENDDEYLEAETAAAWSAALEVLARG
jgi:hypothetical protein